MVAFGIKAPILEETSLNAHGILHLSKTELQLTERSQVSPGCFPNPDR